MHVLAFQPEIDGRLVPQRASHESRTDHLALDRPVVARIADQRRVGVRPIGKRVPPVLIQSTLHGPARRGAVAQVEIRRRVADEGRLRAAACRQPVLEPTGGEELGQHPIGAVEFADLAERTIGDEVDGVFAVAHREVDAERARRVGRIVGDEVAAAIRFDRPPRFERAAVAQRSDERWPDERGVGNGDALERARARARGRYIAEPQLLDPAVLAPDAGPRGIDVQLAPLSRTDTLRQHLERSAADVRANSEPVGRTGKRIARRRKERIIDDDAVPGRALQAQNDVGAHAIGTPQVGLARGFPPQPPRDRQAAGINDRGGQIRPIDRERHAEQVAQTLTADVELRGLEANEFPLDAHAAIAVLHRIAVRIDHDAEVAGIDCRFEPSIRGETMADLDELKKL